MHSVFAARHGRNWRAASKALIHGKGNLRGQVRGRTQSASQPANQHRAPVSMDTVRAVFSSKFMILHRT